MLRFISELARSGDITAHPTRRGSQRVNPREVRARDSRVAGSDVRETEFAPRDTPRSH